MTQWHDMSARFGLQGLRLTILCTALALLGFVGAATQNSKAPRWILSPQGELANGIAPLSAVVSPAATDPHYLALRHAVENQIAQAPEFAAFFDRFRRAFPIDYDLTLQRGIDRMDGGEPLDPPDQYVLDAISVLRRGRGLLAARARDAQLIRVFELQGQTLVALSDLDPHLCVGFLYGAAGPGFAGFAASHRQLVADMANAGLEAVLDGQAHRIVRAPPAEADFQRIETELSARGVPSQQIDVLLDGTAPQSPMPDGEFCRAAVAYLDVLKLLPMATRLSIYALSVELMSRS